MGNVFLLTWKPPEEQNGVIQSYCIKIVDSQGIVILNETTEGDNLYFLVDCNLTEGNYTFKVAANTIEFGMFSNGTLIVQNQNPLSQGM